MPRHRRGSWEETRRELGQFVWAVGLIDVIAIGLGALFSRGVGAIALKFGVALAVFVTVCFFLLVAANLIIEALIHSWSTRSRR